MFLLSILPDFVFHLITIVGILGLVVGFLLSSIPFVNTYAREIQIGAVILTVVGVWFEGGMANEARWQKLVADAEARALKAEALAAEANGKIEYKIVEKTKVVEVVDRRVQQQIKEIATKMDQRCYVIPEANTIHNDAATARKGVKK